MIAAFGVASCSSDDNTDRPDTNVDIGTDLGFDASEESLTCENYEQRVAELASDNSCSVDEDCAAAVSFEEVLGNCTRYVVSTQGFAMNASNEDELRSTIQQAFDEFDCLDNRICDAIPNPNVICIQGTCEFDPFWSGNFPDGGSPPDQC